MTDDNNQGLSKTAWEFIKTAAHTTDVFMRATANALTFGQTDRAAAAADSLLLGKGSYAANLKNEHERTETNWREYPLTSTWGTAAGGVTPMVSSLTTAAAVAKGTVSLTSKLYGASNIIVNVPSRRERETPRGP